VPSMLQNSVEKAAEIPGASCEIGAHAALTRQVARRDF